MIRPTLLTCLLAFPILAQQPAPSVLRDQVPNRRLAQSEPFAIGNLACRAVQRGGVPFLVWSANDAAPLAIPRDVAGAGAWLVQHADDLGHGGFTPVHSRSFDWRGSPVLAFTLQRGGVPLHDAEVWVCFDAAHCLGIVNKVPAGLATPPPPIDGANEPIYAVRRGNGGTADRLVFAARRHVVDATHDVTEFVDGGEVFARESTQIGGTGRDLVPTFSQFSYGGFPDQIAPDSRGVIWCSDPTNSRLIEIDPQTGAPTYHSTSPWTEPDGICIDDRDRVWTGLYTAGNGLGVYDRATGTFTRYAPPQAFANCAIPAWTNNGILWVSDHPASRLTPFNPATATWGTAVLVTSGSWPVGGHFEPTSGDVFVPLYQSNAVVRIRNGALVQQYPTPPSGPAFVAAANGKVWISYWLSSQLGELDVATGVVTTYNISPGGSGGPIDVGPNGHVYLGTRNAGYIVDFDPLTNTSSSYAIPSPAWQLKDGLCAAPDGTIWFTSSYTGQVVRMTLQ